MTTHSMATNTLHLNTVEGAAFDYAAIKIGLASHGECVEEIATEYIRKREKPTMQDAEWSAALTSVPHGDKTTHEQITFALSAEQAETVREAIGIIKKQNPECRKKEQNVNGNALAILAEWFLECQQSK